MKLTSKNNGRFPKFANVGDVVSGRFVSFTKDAPGKFGPENVLILEDDDGQMTVRAPSVLSNIIEDNRERILPGQALKITFVKEKPSGKGNPIKIFDVEMPEPDDSVPF